MKKSVFILVAIALVGMTNLTEVALSFSEDPQWTPFQQTWKEKLGDERKRDTTQAIPICSSQQKVAFTIPMRLQR